MHCTLLIPNLCAAAGTDDLAPGEIPALSRLLARSRRTLFAATTLEAWLCTAFEVERQLDWPVAPLTLALDGGDPAAAYWLRSDPIHLRAQRSQLVLAQAADFALTVAEANALIATLNAHFANDGLSFHAPRSERWYVKVAAEPALITYPLPAAVGRDIDSRLPAGDDRLRWHRTLNEIQMLLHEHPVNEAREQRGEVVINSVWLWGGGVSTTVTGRAFTDVCADDVLACALATLADANPRPLPATAAAMLAGALPAASRLLVVLDPLRQAWTSGGASAWRDMQIELERDWYEPVCRALRASVISGVAIVALDDRHCARYDVAPADLWKFWRRPKPLSRYG